RLDQEIGDVFVGESERMFWVSIVGNEVGHLEVNRKQLTLTQLPKELEGLTITHFSDLHITGAIVRPYFQRLKEEIQLLDSDLVILTGDVLDDKAKLSWVTDLVSDLNAKIGCFFVLGNHDVRHAQDEELRKKIQSCGWQDLGGRTLSLEIHGQQVVLAGNELPWIGEAPECSSAKSAFSICAVHTPDQFRWGRKQGFDLMLAGHAHGGQIRLPFIGPVICPSVHGVRYASGVFASGENLLHVSRGISGLQPLRWRCRPELTQLILSRRED
ncbi:MAG: metallophosphoesterase, partial [Planctomycetota bacterium]|nr:metallophosphoesterase [Planctomycetota bacterium]